MFQKLILILLFTISSFAYTDGTVLVLKSSATPVTWVNTGPLGGMRSITVPNNGNLGIRSRLSRKR